MRVLVTGGAGFIGSFVVERLLDRGESVVCIDDFNPFYDPAIKRHNLRTAMQNPRFTLVEADICDNDALTQVFDSGPFDVVVHLAARAGVRPSIDEPALYYRVNCEGTALLFEQCRRVGVKRITFASSSSVYGLNTKIPFSEADPVLHPISPYAATKRAGELLAFTYSHLYNMDISCLRFFTVYGPRQRPEMAIHRFIDKIEHGDSIVMFGDGSSARDYTYIDDIVDGIVGAVDHHQGYGIYNLGGLNPVLLRDLIKMVGSATGKPVVVRNAAHQPGDVEITCADTELAAQNLHYHPRVSLQEGIRRMVEWYRTERYVPAVK
ncbi:MAG: GDP-mannose 4,6-dehydratase [Myxococcales bacterium]|nr:GDP-mannose 4,6-dehydratase [Myxococcales bacterium]